MVDWTSRDFTVAECAAMSGIHRANIDLIVHRAKGCDVLFSEKRGRNRWFSPQDIAVLRIAYECERAGQTWLAALARAFEHLQDQPAADAVMVFRANSVSAVSGRLIPDRDVERLPVDEAIVLIPVGKIVWGIVERCDAIEKEADIVAVQ